jgi:uncharacterized repeat protein (TIGR03833 family)
MLGLAARPDRIKCTRLTHGSVKEILMKSSYHPQGIKVSLETGEVYRVTKTEEKS